MSPVLLATNNLHKVEEIKKILKPAEKQLRYLGDFRRNKSGYTHHGGILENIPDLTLLPPPEENGKTYYENALIKALYYHNITGMPTLADDSGIEIDALAGEPGIHSARFIDPALSFSERNKIVLERMKDITQEGRGARFVCCCVLVVTPEDIRTETGVLEGKIATEMKGSWGFGYDPIFFVPELNLNLAEVPPQVKNNISHRFRAFNKILSHLSLLQDY